jgi:hypothetical protein
VILVFLPAESFRSTSWFLVITNRPSSSFAESSGKTLPHPQSIEALVPPAASSTPSQPAAPPGMVSAHSPTKGFVVAATESEAQPTMASPITAKSEYERFSMGLLCLGSTSLARTNMAQQPAPPAPRSGFQPGIDLRRFSGTTTTPRPAHGKPVHGNGRNVVGARNNLKEAGEYALDAPDETPLSIARPRGGRRDPRSDVVE